jgi:hypothetical protein
VAIAFAGLDNIKDGRLNIPLKQVKEKRKNDLEYTLIFSALKLEESLSNTIYLETSPDAQFFEELQTHIISFRDGAISFLKKKDRELALEKFEAVFKKLAEVAKRLGVKYKESIQVHKYDV